jgi:hypothetical protein
MAAFCPTTFINNVILNYFYHDFVTRLDFMLLTHSLITHHSLIISLTHSLTHYFDLEPDKSLTFSISLSLSHTHTHTHTHTMEGTFHRRELKSPAVAFSSKVRIRSLSITLSPPHALTHSLTYSLQDGVALFREALSEGHMENYFFLSEQFTTQAHPAYCGYAPLLHHSTTPLYIH